MAAIGEYPKFKSIDELPYLISLKVKLIYAKDLAPHKVEYYKALIKEAKDNISYESMKELLINNGYILSTGIHGLIFVTPPANVGYKRTFTTIAEAYNHYLNKTQQ